MGRLLASYTSLWVTSEALKVKLPSGSSMRAKEKGDPPMAPQYLHHAQWQAVHPATPKQKSREATHGSLIRNLHDPQSA